MAAKAATPSLEAREAKALPEARQMACCPLDVPAATEATEAMEARAEAATAAIRWALPIKAARPWAAFKSLPSKALETEAPAETAAFK